MPSTTDATRPDGPPETSGALAIAAPAAGFRRQALAIAAVALAMRAVHLVQLRSSPFFGWLVGDPERYHAWASSIAAGDWLGGGGVFFQAPLYPYLLAVLYRLLGADPAWARVAQIALGVGSCVLVAAATRRIVGERAGIWAGLLLALYPPALFFEVVLQKSALDVFLVALLLLLVARAWTAGPGSWLAAGCAGGALVLTRENASILLVGLAVWLLVDRSRGHRGARVRSVAGLALGVALILAPVALRNWIVGGELVVSSSQLGRNLYYGNGPDAQGTYVPLIEGRGGIRWEDADARRVAEEASGRTLEASEVSSYWIQRTIEHVLAHPVAWLGLELRKLRWTFASLELMDTEDQYTYRDWAPVAKLLGYVLHFGVLLPLAVLGAFAAGRFAAPRMAGLLGLWIALYAASVVVFFVLDRYRLPLAALILPFAAAGLAYGGPWLARATPRLRAVAGLVVVVAAIVSNWPVRSLGPMKARTFSNLGASLAGDPARLGLAEAALEQALRLRPGFADALHNLGVVRERMGRPAEAVKAFESALEHGRETAIARRHLAFNLAALGRWEEAAAAYERALELEPDDATTAVRLGIVRAESGDLGGAAVAFERALAIDPDNRAVRENLDRARSLLAEEASSPAGD